MNNLSKTGTSIIKETYPCNLYSGTNIPFSLGPIDINPCDSYNITSNLEKITYYLENGTTATVDLNLKTVQLTSKFSSDNSCFTIDLNSFLSLAELLKNKPDTLDYYYKNK